MQIALLGGLPSIEELVKPSGLAFVINSLQQTVGKLSANLRRKRRGELSSNKNSKYLAPRKMLPFILYAIQSHIIQITRHGFTQTMFKYEVHEKNN